MWDIWLAGARGKKMIYINVHGRRLRDCLDGDEGFGDKWLFEIVWWR